MPKAAQDSQFKFLRQHRLVKKQDFQSVFAAPYKISFKYLLALFKTNQQPYARLGVIIAKRYVKTAVDRNRLKRTVRDSFRKQQNALKGLDIIVLMRSECTALENKKALSHDVEQLWLKISYFMANETN